MKKQFENDETRAERDLEELMNPTTTQVDTPEPQGQVEVAQGEAVVPKPEDDGYKQRYSTLQGMMRAEREKWGEEKSQLLRQIDELKSRSTPQNDTVEVADDYRSALVTDEVRQSLAYRRMAELNGQRHTEIHFESLAQMAPKKEEETVTTDNGFLGNLDRLVKGWRQLNQDPGFLAFLAQVAPYSGGQTLQDKLDIAVQAQDAAAAAQFFIDYAEQKTQPPATRQTPEELVVPPKRGSNAHVAAETNQGKVYTLAEWNKGWKDLELGNMPATAAATLEADLTAAPGEGRVVG